MIKPTLTSIFMKEVGLGDDPAKQKLYLWTWWANPQSKTSLRLSPAGFKFLTDVLNLESYSYSPPPFYNTIKISLQLDKYMSVPFYMPKTKNITLFGERDAIMLTLMDGDLVNYLENLSLS